jgi:hypothetical protein
MPLWPAGWPPCSLVGLVEVGTGWFDGHGGVQAGNLAVGQVD